MVSMSHSLLLRDLSILPTPVRWRSEYAHIVAQSREYVHTTYRVEVCPTRYEVATPILPRPQSYLSGGIPPRPRLAKGFLLCISYEVLSRSVTQPRSVASHTRSHAWPLVRAPPLVQILEELGPPVGAHRADRAVRRGVRDGRVRVEAGARRVEERGQHVDRRVVAQSRGDDHVEIRRRRPRCEDLCVSRAIGTPRRARRL